MATDYRLSRLPSGPDDSVPAEPPVGRELRAAYDRGVTDTLARLDETVGEAIAVALARTVAGIIARREGEAPDVCRFHRELADDALATVAAALTPTTEADTHG